MPKQSKPVSHEERPRQETVTPFLERSLTELITLVAQLFTTPFAFLSYNKAFREQITALDNDDLKTAYPETVARPLSFFVLMMSAHFLMLGTYWRLVFPNTSLKRALDPAVEFTHYKESAAKLVKSFHAFAEAVGGQTQAFVFVAFVVALIVAVKALLVAASGRLIGCSIRFKSVLNASSYAFGTFIFFQYVLILIRYSAGGISDHGFQYGYGVIAYGSLALAMLLVVRVNQTIRQSDGTDELPTYAAWLVGTVLWQFAIIFVASQLVWQGDFWDLFKVAWGAFYKAFTPTSLLHPS